ncbi:hypothetical protein EV13_1942 [Prochlorococcus sp. MIT 0702]|nr:hypothetical protein EV13_1942 [Prochlorococcus sp. MIT 0702]
MFNDSCELDHSFLVDRLSSCEPGQITCVNMGSSAKECL